MMLCAALRCQLLRYDIDPTEATWLLNEQKAVYRLIEADDQELLRDEILSIFADICSLFRRELDPAEAAAQDEQVHSAEQDLLTYLRSRDTHVERLPVVFLENLQRALAHYGIRGQIPSPRLDESLLLMYKSHLRVNQQLAAIIAILERRFAQAGRLASLATEDKRAMLNRLLLATQGRYPAVNDLAREMRFRCFDEPWFEQARNKVYQEMQAHLASLTSHPTAADRVELISLLVTYPQPLQNFLTSRFPQSDEQMRKTMLEVLTRRYYRIRRLEDFECTTVAGQTFAKAAYDYEGARIVAVTTFARYEELDAATTAMARFVTRFPDVHGVVVVANLSGFDGSPESMRNSELEFGAEIGRAVTNFRGPLVFCIISRLHGGSFVVFSRTLNENIEIAAVEGSYASVIGGIPAAAVVFARDVDTRTKNDPRVKALQEQLAKVDSTQKTALHAQLHAAMEQVRSEKVGEVAGEFDHIHTIQRAQRVGSVDYVIPAAMLRPYIVEALERGIARELQRWNIDS